MKGDQADSLRNLVIQYREMRQAVMVDDNTYRCRVLTVTGGKGGVGKTNIAVNLSLVLAQCGVRVLLLDGDLGLANVDLLLGLTPKFTLEHVFQRKVSLADIVVRGPVGLDILPGGSGLAELADLNSLEITRLLGLLRILERDYDLIVIDTAAGIGEMVTRFAAAANDVLVVSTPEPTSMVDAYGLLKTLSEKGLHGRLRLIVNMVRHADDDQRYYRSLAATAQTYLNQQLELLGSIPYDPHIIRAVTSHEPLVLHQPSAKASRTLQQIARTVLAEMPHEVKTPAGKGFFGRLLEIMR